jgi:hypothetical protein
MSTTASRVITRPKALDRSLPAPSPWWVTFTSERSIAWMIPVVSLSGVSLLVLRPTERLA